MVKVIHFGTEFFLFDLLFTPLKLNNTKMDRFLRFFEWKQEFFEYLYSLYTIHPGLTWF
jgi:hypothetical protein